MGGIVNAFNAQIPDISGFPTRAECEAARAQINSIRYTLEGCTTYATATPCVGHDVGGVGGAASIANPTVGATAQGTSFFYTTAPEEVKNWQAEQDRINALIGNIDTTPETGLSKTADKGYNAAVSEDLSKYNYSSSSGVYIGNGVFTGIPATPLKTVEDRADMATVMLYLGKLEDDFYEFLLMHPSEIYTLLPQKYKELTSKPEIGFDGYDIDVIVNKDPASRSPEEQAALDNYNAYVKEVCSEADKYAIKRIAEIDSKPEKKEIDMSILAELSYNSTDSEGYELLTNYRKVGKEDLQNNPQLKILLEAINYGNDIEYSGFHAELFYNEFTNEYTIAFQGSNDLSLMKSLSEEGIDARADWIYTNLNNGLGGTPAQFNIARSIAIAVNACPDTNINITGHSLGGALAGYVGLLTGRDTYTFNAEGLNPSLINDVPNYDDSKIRAYHSSYEALTNTQKVLNAAYKYSDVGTHALDVPPTAEKDLYILKVPGKEITLGNRSVTDMVTDPKGHSMDIIIEHFLDNNRSTQTQWSDVHAYRNSIANSAQDTSLLRQDHILIVAQ